MKLIRYAGISMGLLLVQCASIPIHGQLTYFNGSGQSISLGSDGKSIIIDGSFRAQK